MRPFRKLLSVLAVLSLVGAGCGSAGGDQSTDSSTDPSTIYQELAAKPYDERIKVLEEKAREEGQVVLYSSRDSDILQAWQDDFAKAYPGIDFQFLSAEPNVLYERIGLESRGGAATADVVMVGEELKLLNDDGRLATLHGAMIPEGIPDDGYADWYMLLSLSPVVIAWNTNLLDAKDAPTTWEDLLDPRFKGKVAFDVYPDSWLRALIKEWGYDKTRDYIDRLINENDALVRKGHSNMMNLMIAGEFPVAAELLVHNVEEAKAKGAPLEWVALDPTPRGTGSFGILADAPHPYAAALVSHYFLSKRGAKIWVSDGRIHSNPDVTQKYPRTAELVESPHLESSPLLDGPEPLEQAKKLSEEVIVPHYTGSDD